MGAFLQNIGILAIAFAIVYGYQKIVEYCEGKQSDFLEDEKVYKAADAFARGVPFDEVKALLTGCFDFGEEAAGKILSRASPHRTDRDGGYRAFIGSVNKVLGKDIYDERRHIH